MVRKKEGKDDEEWFLQPSGSIVTKGFVTKVHRVHFRREYKTSYNIAKKVGDIRNALSEET